MIGERSVAGQASEPVEMVVIRRPADLDPYVDAIVGVYDRAFREPPYNHSGAAADGFREALAAHRTYPDFEAILLLEGDRLLGFIYGHTNRSEHWWYRQIAPALRPRIRADAFDDAWVVVELAVDPDARRRGYGRWLLEASMQGKPNRSVVLSTMDADSPAVRLYDEEGFRPLLSGFVFTEGMGRWLVLVRQLD